VSEITDIVYRNINLICEKVGRAAERSGRSEKDITIVVVTKTRSIEEIEAVLAAGVKEIGENRVQEALGKRPAINGEFTFRLIGHLQRNKAADAVRIFNAIDSVDSIRLGRKLSEELTAAGKTMPVLIQVNSSAEESKHGFEPNEIEAAAAEIAGMPGLDLNGIMTIGPLTDDEGEIRRAFKTTRELYERLAKTTEGFEKLSMGMSDDYEAAIEEGSNMVRIGRAVFERR